MAFRRDFLNAYKDEEKQFDYWRDEKKKHDLKMTSR